MAVMGIEVQHANIHLVPLRTEGDIDFRKKKISLTPEQFKEIATSISNAFNKI